MKTARFLISATFLHFACSNDVCRSPEMGDPVLLAEKDGIGVWTFDDFLSDAECDALLNSGELDMDAPLVCFDALSTLWWYSYPHGRRHKFVEGTMCVNETASRALLQAEPANGRRITFSSSRAFYPGEDPVTSIFQERAAQAAAQLPTHYGSLFSEHRGGKYQVTRYSSGQGYASHTDCVVGREEKRDRAATLLVYLHDTPNGGETIFPELGVSVAPTKGKALLFTSMNARTGKCVPTSKHEAAPPGETPNSTASVPATAAAADSEINRADVTATSGTLGAAAAAAAASTAARAVAAAAAAVTAPTGKTILQRWYYFEPFETLGKRPAEPDLPRRRPRQPKVNCDGVGGYCRLYDEWGQDHLTGYRRQIGL